MAAAKVASLVPKMATTYLLRSPPDGLPLYQSMKRDIALSAGRSGRMRSLLLHTRGVDCTSGVSVLGAGFRKWMLVCSAKRGRAYDV